ncbi:MAG: hypothetical protein CM15mP74_17110 [Halieaceae bacterium]|nr:MAG: hypothetical protein CM15mP74_17110 [Halieaceae bacterium]
MVFGRPSANNARIRGYLALKKKISKFERKESKGGNPSASGFLSACLWQFGFAACGYRIVGFDVDLSKIKVLLKVKAH